MKKEYRKPQILVETIDGDCLLGNLSMEMGGGGGNAGGAHSKGFAPETSDDAENGYPTSHNLWDE